MANVIFFCLISILEEEFAVSFPFRAISLLLLIGISVKCNKTLDQCCIVFL